MPPYPPQGPQLVRPKSPSLSPTQTAAQTLLEENRIQAYTDYATGLSFEERDDPSTALDHYEAAALSDPSYEPLVIEVARRHLQARNPTRALDILQPSADRPEASALVHAWLGLAHAQADHPEQAVAANRQAIRRAPRFLMPHQNLFQIYLQSRQYPQARSVLQEAAQVQDPDPAFCLEIAQLAGQLARLQPDDAPSLSNLQRSLLDRARLQHPENPLLLERLADAYAQLPDATDPAEELYRKILDRRPAALSVREKLFRLYLKTGRTADATAQLEAFRREQPTNPATYYLLGDLAADEKQYDLAIEHLATALRLDPNFEPVYYELAGVYLMHERPQDALDLIANARKRFKPRFALEYYAGLAHSAAKNYRQAVQCFLAAELFAQAAEPERLTHIFYFQYGAACERAQDFAEAERLFRRCLELQPQFPEALNYLGYMWAERGQNLQEARQLIEQAVNLEPKNSAFLDSLAWVLYQLQLPTQALSWMQQAIQLAEEPDPTLYDHLGDILAALQRLDEARQAWQRALDLQPDDNIRRKLAPHP